LEQLQVEVENEDDKHHGQPGTTRSEKGRVKAEHKDVLLRRWKQIRDIVNTAVNTLQS
jgi:hypothetical protein